MANLRILEISVVDSTTITAGFTHDLDSLINTSNVSITPNVESLPTPTVSKVSVLNKTLTITTSPLTPNAYYFITFQSSSTTTFKSQDGSATLFEDGNTNVKLITGAENPDNPIRNYLLDVLKDNVFSLQTGTLVRDIINSQSETLARGLYDIKQSKNDNYLSHSIVNELKTRGKGPYDRLNEEGAYFISRVGKAPQATTSSATLNYTSFPSTIISLQQNTIASETLIAGSGNSTFDKLILTTSYGPVIRLRTITFVYASGTRQSYDVTVYGYKLKTSKYDENYASTLLTLNDNQIELNTNFLDSGFALPVAGDSIIISYDYKSLGRVVDADSVVVSQIVDITREVTPPILTQFTLDYYPVVTASGAIATTGGITFLDPESNPAFSSTHPAFQKEITFRLEGLPKAIGEYSVDYETGRVFVYGAVKNDGTGNFPPTATYKYKKSYNSRLDYTYDSNTSELSANPLRDLINKEASIAFDYEQVLVPNIDYIPQIHEEKLNERIQNRLHATNRLSVLYTPITNVFRIYNETSGEIYNATRWSEDSVYFTYNTPPRINDVFKERASFTNILNETLIVNEESTNSINTKIFKIILQYNRIFSASEDVIGSSFNSSVSFSRTDIFETELYFDSQILTITDNINRLRIGQYQIDYENGVIYLGVSGSQSYDLGTVNYKNSIINPTYSHVIGVNEIYHQISEINGISKRITYSSVGEGSITPSSFDRADERFADGDTTDPYIISSGTITVTDDVKSVRGIYDVYDLNNNNTPTNFANNASISANIITIDTDGILKQKQTTVKTGLTLTVPFISNGIEIGEVTKVTRITDGVELYDSSTTFSGYTITLSAGSGAVVGDLVLVEYYVVLNAAATPVIDYNRGDYYIDYEYLADEILVSYEYGDNVLDFRASGALDPGDTYYVSYKVGALRQGLLQNFGSLVNIPILNNFDTTLERERYRDALIGALQSFTKGPTIPALKLLVSSITHIDPELTESAFKIWSLGISKLYSNPIYYTDGTQLMPGKFDNGVLVNQDGYTVSFPIVDNLKLEEGTLETWIIPEWDGLDNDSTLTIQINKDGYSLAASSVYIGSTSYNPTYDSNNKFTVNKDDTTTSIGLPSAVFTQTGAFVYYDDDAKRWKILAKDFVGTDPTSDGYVYSGTIESSGEIYDAKFLPGLGEIDDVIRSDISKIYFEFHLDGYDVLSPDGYQDIYVPSTDGYVPGDGYIPGYSFDGITFMADDEHYIFDFGKTNDTSRFSLYKDGRGYLNFRVYDDGKFITDTGRRNQYKVSADISNWKAGVKYFIAITWKLNTSNNRDEMHLFINGEEVPNILRFGGRPTATSTDRFRTVAPEIIVGTVPKVAITYDDLHTVAGSPIVYSDSINFDTSGVVAGDSIHILETNFTTYTILSVSGKILTLDTNMPLSYSDARFSVNEYSAVVSSEINLYNNIAVSIIDATTGVETEIAGLRADIPGYSLSKNLYNQDILTLLGDANVGDQIAIRTLGLNYRRCREKHYLWGNTNNVIKTQLPPPVSLSEAKVYPVLFPLTSIGPNNATLMGGQFVATGLTASQPSNATEGRTLSVRITGENVDFSTQVNVVIYGNTPSGPGFETVTFNKARTRNTTRKFASITSITVTVNPIINTKDSIAVEIKEAYYITWSEGNVLFPIIKYSYQTSIGTTLQGTGSHVVSDSNGYFIKSDINRTLIITAPAAVAGTYTITNRLSNTQITLSPTPATAFTNGTYTIYEITNSTGGFQNGYFTFETAGEANSPYLLNEGWYEFDYATYLQIPFDPISNITAHIGSDRNNSKPANAIIDEFRILSLQLTDVRVGETIGSTTESITTDYTALNPFEANSDTLTLIHFDELPFTNDSDYWISSIGGYLQSNTSVNDNFERSILITDRPLIVDNKGRLDTSSEGSIEFWVSPKFDTYNDPNFRFYFDAYSAVVEEVVSTTKTTITLQSSISSILSVRLQTDTNNTGIDYFKDGSIGPNFKTITLGRALPSQNTPVKIAYIPAGAVGDRISIYKNQTGHIIFNVRANNIDYRITQPIFWNQNTWHRIRATFKFNRSDNKDEIRFFVDGEEKGGILFGSGLLFGEGAVWGQGLTDPNAAVLVSDINFLDTINQFFIGSDYLGVNLAAAKIDNLRISNISRNPKIVAGQPTGVNYSSNLNIVYPVIEDLYTTYLLNFDIVKYKATEFALLKNSNFGLFDFDLDIIDSFDIVSSNRKVKQVLETLINLLKPAQSKVTITYV